MKKVYFITIIVLFAYGTTKAQGFRENYYEQIVPSLIPEYQEAIKEAEVSISQAVPFETEGIRLRTLAEQEEQTENVASESHDLNNTIKKENKLFKKSTETYAVAADLYLEALYIKYNVYSKTLNPMENKAKGEDRKDLFKLKQDASTMFKRANFSSVKAQKATNLRQQYEFYAEAVKFGINALNLQAEEFRIVFNWPKTDVCKK
jgi:hypothetical protein